MPTATQLEAELHATELTIASLPAGTPAGSGALVAVHEDPDPVTSRPWPVLTSAYEPTATQRDGAGQVTALRLDPWVGSASPGSGVAVTVHLDAEPVTSMLCGLCEAAVS